MISIFIPTTPNPTSGWYAIVPEDDVINLSISIEDAFKVLISGGIVSPSTKSSPSSVPISLPNVHNKLHLEEKRRILPLEEES